MYVATDEKNGSFFEPLRLSRARSGYRLVFMRDVYAAARLGEVEGNWLGMVDQVCVCVCVCDRRRERASARARATRRFLFFSFFSLSYRNAHGGS